MASSSKGGVRTSAHPLILHKITQMRKSTNSPKYLHQLIKEVSSFLCYEATADMSMEGCEVKTRVGAEEGQRIGDRVGIIPVLRGGLGMVEAMTEMVSNAQVWHLGIYRDKTSLLPIEYYNKLPKKVTVHTVYVLDPMPISGATAVAAMDILKAWGEGLKATGKTLKIKFICIVASEVRAATARGAIARGRERVGVRSVRGALRVMPVAVCVGVGADDARALPRALPCTHAYTPPRASC